MQPRSGATWMNDPKLAQMPVAQVAERNRHAPPVLLDVTAISPHQSRWILGRRPDGEALAAARVGCSKNYRTLYISLMLAGLCYLFDESAVAQQIRALAIFGPTGAVFFAAYVVYMGLDWLSNGVRPENLRVERPERVDRVDRVPSAPLAVPVAAVGREPRSKSSSKDIDVPGSRQITATLTRQGKSVDKSKSRVFAPRMW
eukprot:g25985.t1